MIHRLAVAGAVLLGALPYALPAAAQALPGSAFQGPGRGACGKRADIVRHLADTYEEKPVSLGLADNGALVELLASKDRTTWTLLMSMANGMSCLIATGQDWQEAPPAAPLPKPEL